MSDFPAFLVDPILPTEELHLIAGPAAAGKTTWLIQFIQQWQAEEPIFGYASHALPFVYVALERSLPGTRRTLQRLGVNPDTFPHIGGLEERLCNIDQIIDACLKAYPEAKVLFIEAIASLLPLSKSSTEYRSTMNFLGHITYLCQQKHLTIIGTVHSPKTKANEKYESPRHRVLGSTAWAASVETIILIEPDDKVISTDQVTDLRSVFVLPRNAPEELYEMTRDSTGRIVLSKTEDCTEAMDNWLQKLPPGTEFTTESCVTIGNRSGFSPRSSKRWLSHTLKDSLIEKKGHGIYRKPVPVIQ